jgi:23S rRNA A2030 N6-methylase RlmJ
MANHHFGKFADVWKHLVLDEVLASTKPARYAETHAGSAAYRMVEDQERRYGVLGFLARQRSASLTAARYTQLLAPFISADPPLYPGSALQAMTVLGAATTYRLCDLDPTSAGDLRSWAERLHLADCQVIEDDGMTAVQEWLPEPASTVVHIDPFDPFDHRPGAPSAIELASSVADAGHTLVYWYGYSSPSERLWAADEIRRGSSAALWWGDFMVTTADGSVRHDGDLGKATTPGTGCGVVLANIPTHVTETCEALAEALRDAYAGETLPTGEPGRLESATGRRSPSELGSNETP